MHLVFYCLIICAELQGHAVCEQIRWRTEGATAFIIVSPALPANAPANADNDILTTDCLNKVRRYVEETFTSRDVVTPLHLARTWDVVKDVVQVRMWL